MGGHKSDPPHIGVLEKTKWQVYKRMTMERQCHFCGITKPIEATGTEESGWKGITACWDCRDKTRGIKLPQFRKPVSVPEGKKFCSGCAQVLDKSAFGPKGEWDICRPCNILHSRLLKQQRVKDPTTGETVSRGAAKGRKLVTDPLTGETIRYCTARARQLVTDPDTGTQEKYGKLANKKRNAKIQNNGKTYSANYTAKRREDPLYKLKDSLSTQLNARLRNGKNGDSTKHLVGCSFDFLLHHLKANQQNYNPIDPGWTIDHVVPVSLAETDEQIKALFHWSNLRAIPESENSSKGNRLPHRWEEAFSRLINKIDLPTKCGELILEEVVLTTNRASSFEVSIPPC